MTLALNNFPIEILAGSKLLIRRHDDIFSELSILFLHDLSKLLIKNKENKYSDVQALGFWLRERNLKKYFKKYVDKKKRIGLGLIYHITPSNIPTNFAYSFVFGLVSGNSNIIKVSEKKNDQVDIILKAIKVLFNRQRYKKLKNSNLFIRYQNNDNINKFLSDNCDARIVWGGNDTIKTFRKFPLGFRAREINFPDRFSICILNSEKVANLKEYELDILVKNFYNDTFLVDQNACSSPRLVVWINTQIRDGRKKFWKKLLSKLKSYNLNNALNFERYTILCNILSLENVKLNSKLNDSKLYLTEIKSLKNLSFLSNLKLGIFVEHKTDSIEDAFKIDITSLQTLSYFGIEKEDMLKFFNKNKTRAIDRIVPVGNALEMSMDWDGFPVPHILSRIVDIK